MVNAAPTWSPPARPGVIPLHPVGFGTILGSAFTALRRNPKVLLGFALVVQSVITLAAAAALSFVTLWAFLRLDTLTPGSDEFEAVFAGAIAITVVAVLVVSLITGAVSVVIQGVVIADVAAGVRGDALSLGALWRRVRPVLGRLVVYAVAVSAVVVLGTVALAAAVGAVWAFAGLWAILAGVVAGLGGLVLFLWLSVKLLLVPAVLVVEHAGLRTALARSWHLTRGRFWPTLGITVVINLSFAAVAQVISLPITIATTVLSVVLAPTGTTDSQAVVFSTVVSLLGQGLVVLVQTVGVIVLATAVGIIYVDCRMRHEGLDLDLLADREQRMRGAVDLPDPYLRHIGGRADPRPPWYPTRGPGVAPGAAQPMPAPYGAARGPAVPPTAAPSTTTPTPPASPTPPPPDPTSWARPGGDPPR